jgi:hypothetical protein
MTCQSSFGAALLDPEAPPPPGLTDAQGRPAGRRFDVYRNNVAASLGDALATGFPVISKLLGEEFFRAMAGVFLRAHPPGDPRLQLWGAKFPGFLARFDPVAHLPYLPDMARLELGLRQSYHAADATPLPIAGRDPAEVSGAEAAPRARHADPAVALPGPDDLAKEHWPARPPDHLAPRDVLITRRGFDPELQLLPKGGHTLARHLKGRLTLAEAVTRRRRSTPMSMPPRS